LVLPVLLVRRGFDGICRNHATESMLWGVVDSCSEGRLRLWFCRSRVSLELSPFLLNILEGFRRTVPETRRVVNV
jgi:hypothetical protein